MAEPKLIPGKFVWFELLTPNREALRKAQGFYGEVLGWKSQALPMEGGSYDMILLDESMDSMIGGYAPPKGDDRQAQWLAYASVPSVDAAVAAAKGAGGKVVVPATDIGMGRAARIADPQGAELGLFQSSRGDKPDVDEAPAGGWLWNELHTTDAAGALRFYNQVVGYTHRSMDMGPAGTYHIVSHGGVDRGGVTDHLAAGIGPHWLPYVRVADVDGTVARARKLGAFIPMSPEDIPGIGRFGVFRDPVGGLLAVMNPLPRQK